ncbi:MAG: adenosylcobinamide-GDP ribazoletransferase [Lachnospiraceae bacterium]|nr:adenosylcobinamide-GDP ribazoletransferase [Lachnospiraceae bacterium]
MKRCWNSLNIAFSMYSRLPAAQCDWSEDNMKYVMCFFPWIGVVIGALCYGWNYLAGYLDLHAPLRNVVLMLIPMAVSGGIHLDGFLDTADALSSWRPKEKRLEILKDSHAGAFAILAGVIYFFLMYGVVDMVQGEMVELYAFTFLISRSFSGFSVVTFPKASAKGTVAGFARNAQTRIIQVTCVGYVLLCAAAMLFLHPVYGAAMLAGAALTFVWYYRMAMKNFGGINGDLAGCYLSVSELIMPFTLVAVNVIMSRL